jgi:hypothetical protein
MHMPELTLLNLVTTLLRDRVAGLLRADRESGYTTETVIIVAALAVAALAVVAIIATKLNNKANSIDLN